MRLGGLSAAHVDAHAPRTKLRQRPVDDPPRRLDAPVRGVDEVGWNGDALEAQAFAYLALRSLARLPISFPTTTGVPVPMTGGTLHRV